MRRLPTWAASTPTRAASASHRSLALPPHADTHTHAQSAADYEFHKLLLVAIVKAARRPAGLAAVVNSRFLPMLLRYLAPEPVQRAWTRPQYEEIQLQVCAWLQGAACDASQSLSALSVLLPSLLDEYEKLKCNTQLLEFFEWLAADDAVPRSQHTGARPRMWCLTATGRFAAPATASSARATLR